MIAGSFLVKDLLLPWQKGAQVVLGHPSADADLANNTLGWQWVGGCGADAAPYFRSLLIRSPRACAFRSPRVPTFVSGRPEPAGYSDERTFDAPWKAPREILSRADVHLGETYPKATRQRSLRSASSWRTGRV